MIVRVLPDVVGIDKEFDYSVPDALVSQMRIGTMVRVALSGRRVGAWVTALDVAPPAGVPVKPIAKVTGWGPSAEVIELARWAAWRWAGRTVHLLRTASPPAAVRALPSAGVSSTPDRTLPAPPQSCERVMMRLAPLADRWPQLVEAVSDAEAEGGHALVLCPSVTEAGRLARRLGRQGHATTLVGGGATPSAGAAQWARAAAGAHVVGARAAAWAPVAGLRRVVVLDEHDEGYQQEQTPTWHARDVVIERAARVGAPCLLMSPCPTLEALAMGGLVEQERPSERHGWPRIEVVDRRPEEPASAGLFSPRLTQVLRSVQRVVCVLNRKGRARLLACGRCGELARCQHCGASVQQPETDCLRCVRCGTDRPMVCLGCGGGRFRNLRAGVARVREELEALVGEPVEEVSAASTPTQAATSRVVVGTEAVLHRVERADTVAFLDFDQELTAPRYRATEEALALLVLAARLVRGASDSERADRTGRLLVQTRQPDHQVLAAVAHGDPRGLMDDERRLRTAMRFPPINALAMISGPAAEAFVGALSTVADERVELLGPSDGAWLVRADDHTSLCDALAQVPRPSGRLRIEVDPLRL